MADEKARTVCAASNNLVDAINIILLDYNVDKRETVLEKIESAIVNELLAIVNELKDVPTAQLIASLPITMPLPQEIDFGDEEVNEELRDDWEMGTLNRCLAFDLSELLTKAQCGRLRDFTELVWVFKNAGN